MNKKLGLSFLLVVFVVCGLVGCMPQGKKEKVGSQVATAEAIKSKSFLVKSKNEMISISEKNKLIAFICNVLENKRELSISDEGIEYITEGANGQFPGYIDISILKFTPDRYIYDYGFGVKINLIEEKKQFQGLSLGIHNQGGAKCLSSEFYPFSIAKIGDVKFEIFDCFDKAGATISRHYISFFKNTKVDIGLYIGIPNDDEVNIDFDNNKITYTKKGKQLIVEFEKFINEIGLARFL